MGLVDRAIENELNELNESGVRIRHIGRREGLSPRLAAKFQHAQELTRHNERLILNVAFNYGGRAEIVDAVRQIVAEGLPPERIDQQTFSRYLTTGGLLDPDLVIRTGGDMRLSNFLIWQSAYAEFYSTPTFWPDFNRHELYKALLDYGQRERRFGGLVSNSE